MQPGDVFIMNDPFDGGMHLPDIFVFKPLYHEGERLAFAAPSATTPMSAAGSPARTPPTRPRSTPEGLRIAPLKLYERGQAQRDAHDASSRRTCGCR